MAVIRELHDKSGGSMKLAYLYLVSPSSFLSPENVYYFCNTTHHTYTHLIRKL